MIGSSSLDSPWTISRATSSPNRSRSHTAWEKNRHAAWKEIAPAIRAPASMPTTLRRPVCATIPVANTQNTVNVPRLRNAARSGSSTAAHDGGKIINGR
jgi:hypothetical protein